MTPAAGPAAAVDVAALAAAADEFAGSLGDVVAGEPQLRYQGMPSDGDSPAVYRALGEAGWIGVHWPPELGGLGLSSLHTLACEERFGYHWLPLSGYLLSVKTIGNALLAFGSRQLQERLVPEVAAGRLLFCQGFSEPDAGSDLASLRTRARAADGGFIVSGRKIWTSSAEYADWVYLAVRTDPQAEPHRGISVLVADMNTPGITVSTHRTLGGGTIGELELDEVAIPANQLVGELHGGWRVLMGTLDYERVTSEKVGTVLWLLDALAPLAGDPARRRALSRLRGAAEAARLHGRRAARLLEEGRPASAQSSMAKLSVAELMQRVAAFAVELLGPEGLLEQGTGTLARPRGRVPAGRGGHDHLRRRRRDPAFGDRPARARLPAAMNAALHTAELPLHGIRVLEYAQYVAGPFAGMLLADLGADVIKIEPPAGDAWRRYEPFAEGESRYFYALNRNKRSVVLDLKDGEGRQASQSLIRTADVVLHNLPPVRAQQFGLDRETVRETNPEAVWCCVSALGSDGPESSLTAFDLVAQALSGLMLSNAHAADRVPQRAGGIAMADFTAGLLAAIAALAGLLARHRDPAPGLEISLLGASLAVQAQRFVSVEQVDGIDRRPSGVRPALATADDHQDQIHATRAADELEPYYRAYAAADGFFVLACLHERQRAAAAAVLGLDDPWVANPQAPPASLAERQQRLALAAEFERRLAAEPADVWVRRFRAAGVPAAEVRVLDQLFEHDQVRANGLVQTVHRDGVGDVRLLGSLFKIDGVVTAAQRSVPTLGEHTEEVLAQCREPRS